MKEWQATAIVILLALIAISLGFLVVQGGYIIDAIDHGKFMPFIYTGE